MTTIAWVRLTASGLRLPSRLCPDALGVLAFLVYTVVATRHLLLGGTMVGIDSALQFYPRFFLLGERLRSADVPGWNPHQFAGTPFTADPESGWMYLPAMLLFTVLPMATAATVFIFAHFVLASLATYALSRVLGMTVPGALVAATAHGFSGFFYYRSPCCTAHVQVAAWLPLTLLSVELALRSRTWLSRVCWWAATGLAISQILAAWLGQGAYYALVTLGSYLAYRTLLDPLGTAPRFRDRFLMLVLHGAAVLLFGFGLAAASVLPQLEFNALSNLAGGYTGEEAVIGGWELKRELAERLLGQTGWYAGGATVALAFVAPLVARRRFATPYFAVLVVGSLVVAGKQTTLLHAMMYRLLPRFEDLHRHWPDRVLLVFYLGAAMLAGSTVSSLGSSRRRPTFAVFAALLPAVAMLLLQTHAVMVPSTTVYAVILAGLLAAAYAMLPGRLVGGSVLAALAVVVFVDLVATGHRIVARDQGHFFKLDLESHYAAGGAASFLQSAQQPQPVRYFGYDPRLLEEGPWPPAPYRYHFAEPRTTALLVNNRATVVGIQDIQGYNPLQLASYVEYLIALNGKPQEYHEANVLESGLGSPLLNLLNVGYVVVPAEVPPARPDLQRLLGRHPVVYRDDQVTVLENRDALPRAWIVHAAEQVERGEILKRLVTGGVDPRQTALLTEAPPPLDQPRNATADSAVVMGYSGDRIEVRTRTEAAGLLMLSEVYYPAWKAYVDGKQTRVYQADHLLRAVPVPPGEHTVELRFESLALRVGMLISLATYAIVLLLATLAGVRRYRARRSR